MVKSFTGFQHRQVAEPVVQSSEQSSTKSKLRLGGHELLLCQKRSWENNIKISEHGHTAVLKLYQVDMVLICSIVSPYPVR